MLELVYEGERALIRDDGSVDYYENQGHAMVMTEAPSQTIMQLVLAAIPIISSETIEAKMGITRIKGELQAVAVEVRLAENAECIAREARRKQLDKNQIYRHNCE